jgi:glutamate dehydrogenase (NADP+)
MTQEGVDYMLELRASNNDVVEPYAAKFGAKFVKGRKPWEVKCDIAFPCAIQNELNGDDAKMLVENGCTMVVETSNMGCTAEAVNYLNGRVAFAPGKAANAGGVAVSGLEMSQNSMRYSWSADEVDAKLKDIMKSIHDSAYDTAEKYGMKGNYVAGANLAGFIKVADAMVAQGIC